MSQQLPSSFTFTITGPPRTKKNSGQVLCPHSPTSHVQRHVVLPSEAYRDWHKAAKSQLFPVRSRLPRPFDVPVNIAAVFFRESNIGDAAGFYQALGDTLQEYDILTNDRLIEQWDGSRLKKDSINPRVEVTITLLDGTQLSLI